MMLVMALSARKAYFECVKVARRTIAGEQALTTRKQAFRETGGYVWLACTAGRQAGRQVFSVDSGR